MQIGGLYFKRSGQTYDIYNDLNTDPFTYKMYENEIRPNLHRMRELVYNLNDSVLLGSENSFNATTEVLNNFQLRFNKFKLQKDAYSQCKTDAVCSATVDATDQEILQMMMQTAYEEISNEAMSVADYKAANLKVDEMKAAYDDRESFEWFKLVDDFYTQTIEEARTAKLAEMATLFDELAIEVQVANKPE